MARVPSGPSQKSRAAYKAAWEKSGSGRASRMLGGNKLKTSKPDTPAKRARSSADRKRHVSQERYAKNQPSVSFGETGYKEDFDV